MGWLQTHMQFVDVQKVSESFCRQYCDAQVSSIFIFRRSFWVFRNGTQPKKKDGNHFFDLSLLLLSLPTETNERTDVLNACLCINVFSYRENDMLHNAIYTGYRAILSLHADHPHI